MIPRTPKLLFLFLLFLFLLVFSFSTAVQAQIDMGRILGRVTDKSGAVIPHAKITVTNEGTGLTLTTQTALDGNYVLPDLKIGTYQVEIEAAGFASFVQAGIPLHALQDVVVNATLTPGRITQTVRVQGAPPPLQTENASVGQTIGGTEVNDLPLNGRDWTQLAETATGVSVSQPDNSLQRTLFSAAGHDLWVNDYRINGIDNNDDWANPRPSIALPPPDALSEFKVDTLDYGADLGFGGGAVIDAAVKSGTNQIHGDAWEFLRNSTLDAANFFQDSTDEKKGLFQQSQFGFTVGGPVVIPHIYNGRNKTFFFVDYQGLRSNEATPTIDTVPTDTMRASGYTDLQDLIADQSGTVTDDLGRTFPLGTVFDPATTRLVTAGQVDPVTGLAASTTGYVRDPFYEGSLTGITNFTSAAMESRLNMLPADRLDRNASKLLQLYPAADVAGYINDFAYDPSTTTSENQIDFRVDENISAKDQVFVTGDWEKEYLFEPPYIPNSIAGGGDYYGEGANNYGWQAYALSWTHVFSPTVVNEARLGYARSPGLKYPSILNQLGIPAEFGIQGVPQAPGTGGLPCLSMGGLTSMGFCGGSQVYDSVPWDLTENLTKVHGAHTLKAGFQGDFVRDPYKGGFGVTGDFAFSGAYVSVPETSGQNNGLAQLLLSPMASTVPGGFNDVGGADNVTASSFFNTDATHYYFGTYAMDDWKVTPRLTLNIGVRWEHATPEMDRHDREDIFEPGSSTSRAFFLAGQSMCNELSPSFNSLAQKDGIAVGCAPVSAFGTNQKANFAPRLGFAFTIAPKLVARGGYGIFYVDGEEGEAGIDDSGTNAGYPETYSFSYPSPGPEAPITYPNGTIATLESGLSAISFSPTTVNAEGLSLSSRQWNTQSPYYEDYNFTLEYQISPSQTVTLAYVGDQAHHMYNYDWANANSEILPPGLNPQLYVPYPDFARNSTYLTTNGDTVYNSLQVTVARTFKEGFSFNGNYTFSKCMSDFRNILSNESLSSFRAPYLPGFGIQGDYGLCDADEPNLIHFSGLYSLPFGNGRHFLADSRGLVNGLLGGWQTNWILTLQDGQPFDLPCAVDTTADFGCFALEVPGQNIYAGPHNVNHWVNPGAFATPPIATAIGQSNYAPLGGDVSPAHGPGEHRLDFSLFKEFPISESKHFEFRAEVFNLTNTPWFSNPSQLNYTEPSTFGEISTLRDGANDPRIIQFALKFFW
jgi:Carboxypeptidase regulatory-like domain/TonB dependent receptor